MIKRSLYFIVALALFYACKKEDPKNETPAPVTPANGTLNIHVVSYDSVSDLEGQITDTKINLAGTSYSANVDVNGNASFSLPAGSYAPTVFRPGYEGVPFSSSVNSDAATNVNTFIAKNSPYSLTILNGYAASSTSITLSMQLNKAVPAGKQIKVAVLFSKTPGLSVNSYTVFNEYYLNSSSNNNYNIASGAIQSAVNQLNTGQSFYLLAVPVTYGNFYSNILGKNILVGDNLPMTAPTSTIQITKNY